MITLDRSNTEVRAEPYVLPDGYIIRESTMWKFKLPAEITKAVYELIQEDVNSMYDDFVKSGVGMIPSMGEVWEEFAWAMPRWTTPDVHTVGINLQDNEMSIEVNNYPDDPFDRLDPAHPDWFQSSPGQWLIVFNFVSTYLKRIQK